MAKKSRLLAALDTHQGRDYKAEHQKKLAKKAAKAKKSKKSALEQTDDSGDDAGQLNGIQRVVSGEPMGNSGGWSIDCTPAVVCPVFHAPPARLIFFLPDGHCTNR